MNQNIPRLKRPDRQNTTPQEVAIRTYWRDFVARNNLAVGPNQEPRSLQTLFYRLHKIRGSRLTDVEAATVEAKVRDFATTTPTSSLEL